MKKPRAFTLPFAKIYPLYIEKAQKKGRTKEDVDETMRNIRSLDKLVDELAKGRPIENILRS